MREQMQFRNEERGITTGSRLASNHGAPHRNQNLESTGLWRSALPSVKRSLVWLLLAAAIGFAERGDARSIEDASGAVEPAATSEAVRGGGGGLTDLVLFLFGGVIDEEDALSSEGGNAEFNFEGQRIRRMSVTAEEVGIRAGSGGTRGPQRQLRVLLDDDVQDAQPDQLLYSTQLDGSLFGTPALSSGGLGTPGAIRGVVYAEDFVATRGLGTSARVGAMFFDGDGNQLAPVAIDGLPSFVELGFRTPQLLIDEQGRATILYSILPNGAAPQVLAQRVDPVTGALIGEAVVVSNQGYFPTAALLSDSGDSAVVVYIAPPNVIKGKILDLSDPVRGAVGSEFTVSTSASPFSHYAPVVAADRTSGRFMAAWENITGEQFNPVNVLARRFMADGTPLDATDFMVNLTTTNAQSQPSIAAIDGLDAFAVSWTSDGDSSNDLDLYAQVYDEAGLPIGAADIPLTDQDDIQDRSSMKALDERDSQGRPLISVTYRDVANAGGSPRPGEPSVATLVLAINGLTALIPPIFVDGFETGDTSAWSAAAR